MSLEREVLIHRYIDATITIDEMAQLNAMLQVDSAMRREFAELLNLDSALASILAVDISDTITNGATVITFPKPARFLSAWQLTGTAACLSMIVLGALWMLDTHRACATVARVVGGESIEKGAKLHSELVVLQAGSIEIVTARGVRIVVEAPSEFYFETKQRLRMIRGRMSADVPSSAKGFTVVTSSGEAIDLGTRFGVDVPTSGAAEIHVFQGEVMAHPSGARTKQSVLGGDAVTMLSGASSSREFRSAAFIQADEMSGLSAGLASGQQARSDAAIAALKKDAALIAMLDFESDDLQPGVFRTVQGRWPGSRAPEFVNVGDHLKLDVGGDHEWPQLTIAAWVRLDRLGAPYQSLLHTDGWSKSSPGQVHWMVTQQSRMRLALFANTLASGSDETNGFPDSRTSVLPERGRWVHLATVYNSESRSVRFYLNGQFDKETRQAIAHPARLGPAQIGNWDRQDRKLSGRVDELLLLGRAMSDVEVRELFDAGNPYR